MKRKNRTLIPLIIAMSLLSGCGFEQSMKNSSSENTKEDLLVGFSFEESNGNTVVDSVSWKTYDVNYVFKDAAYKGDSQVGRYPGLEGECMTFDGNSIYFESDPIVFPDGDFSLSMYAAPRAFERNDGNYTALFSNLGSVGGIEIALSNFGYWKVIVGTSRGSLQAIVTDSPLKLYQWNHIAAVYSKSSSSLKLFLNGELKNQLDLGTAKILSSSEKVIVGRSPVCQESSVFLLNHFNGLMDEVKIYRHALSTVELESQAEKAKQTKPQKDQGMWMDYETLADDRYAPQYHMRNPLAWSNEFYGGFYFNGKYHVFCQQNPFRGFYQNGQRWGHLTSTDLVHWEAQYPALVPEDKNFDNSQCFSGSAILDQNGNPMLFYTGVNEKNQYLNSIGYATPSDLSDRDLVTWNKGNQKIINQGTFGSEGEFRDPFVYQENGQSFMLIGGSNGANGAAYIYKANDHSLTSWKPLGVCYSGKTADYPVLGTTYELPNLFKLTNKAKTITKYMLMISPIRAYNGVFYWLGDFNLETGVFTPDNKAPLRIDLGPSSQVLAASGFYDTNKQRTLFATMVRTGMSDQDAKLSDWNMGESLWKEIYLGDEGTVRLSPIEEYRSLEKETLLEMSNVSLSVSQADSLFSQVHSDQYKLSIEIDPKSDTKVGVSVKAGNQGEKVTFTYDFGARKFYCDNSRGSFAMRTSGSGGGDVELSGSTLKMSIYVDRSLVEAYVEDRNEISVFAFNSYKESNSLKMFSDQGSALVKNVKITDLADAYGQNKPANWEE